MKLHSLPLLVLLAAMSATFTTRAHALGEERVWRVQTDIAGCEDTFATELVARTRQLTIAKEAPRVLRATVRENEQGALVGTLEVDDGTETAHREIHGATCEAVLSGLALVAAVTIDALINDEKSTPARPAVTPAENKPEPASGPPSVAFAGGGFGEISAVVTSPLFTIGVFGDVASTAPSLFAPSARVRLSGTLPAVHERELGSAELQWMGGALEGCPLRWIASMLAIRPCAGAELGRVHIEGLGNEGSARSRFWAAGRFVGRLDARVFGPIFAELSGGVLVPFTREEFVFSRGSAGEPVTIYRAPPLAALGAGALFVRFP